MDELNKNYWGKRQQKANEKLAKKSEIKINKQLLKYYKQAMNRTIEDFEAVYDKLLATIKDDREITPADLYSLSKYWEMQAQLRERAQQLGDYQVALLSKEFEETYRHIYNGIALPSAVAFSTINLDNAEAMIKAVWCADGKTFSDRIWTNVERLVETLNDELVHCVVTGRDTRYLKKLLKERFRVSTGRAATLVHTEISHIQVDAAAKRYKDAGLTHYKFLAGVDEKTCKDNGHSKSCHELDGKIFRYDEMQVGVNAPRCILIVAAP